LASAYPMWEMMIGSLTYKLLLNFLKERWRLENIIDTHYFIDSWILY